MAMLAFQWSHILALIWLYAGLLATATFLILALLDWKQRSERLLEAALREKRSERREMPETDSGRSAPAETDEQ